MSYDPVLRSAAELLAYIYDTLTPCPLPAERELLLAAGNKSAEELFHSCHLVFGTNMSAAFRKTCVFMADYCDFLVDDSDELLTERNSDTLLNETALKITAVECIAAHAPVDSIEERNVLDSLAYQSRRCHNHLLKQYQAHISPLDQKK